MAQLGASWAPLGLNLELLGRLLASTWALLGPTWRQLGRSWDQLGANLGAFGIKLGPVEPTLGYHGRSCDALGALLVTLRRLWTLQGRSQLDFGAPKKDFGVSETRFRGLRSSIVESLAIVSGL